MANNSQSFLMPTTWPYSCPNRYEELIISIVCSTSRLHWCLHRGLEDEFQPVMYWTTTPAVVSISTSGTATAAAVSDDKDDDDDASTQGVSKPKLSNFLPNVVKDLIYGRPIITDTTTGTKRAPKNASISNSTAATGAPFINTSLEAKDNSTTSSSGITTGGSTSTTIDPSQKKFYTTLQAATYRAAFRIPAVSVYIVSRTNNNTNHHHHVDGVVSLFTNDPIPCKLYHITKHDFLSLQSSSSSNSKIGSTSTTSATTSTTSEVAMKEYNSIDFDRICALEGSKYLVSLQNRHQQDQDQRHQQQQPPPPPPPVLIIDGDATITYTCTDTTGAYRGGGIGPGLRMKFRSLFDYTTSLPYISYDVLMKTIRNNNYLNDNCTTGSTAAIAASTAENPKQPTKPLIPQFTTTSTEKSIIGCVLKETASTLTNIIFGWMNDILQLPEHETTDAKRAAALPTTTTHQIPVVILTGSDCDIFSMLLDKNHSYIVSSYSNRSYDVMFNEIRKAIRKEKIQLITQKQNIAHNGIQSLLLQQVRKKEHEKVTLMKQQEHQHIDVSLSKARDEIIGQRVAKVDGLGGATLASILYGTTVLPKRVIPIYGTIVHVDVPNHHSSSRLTTTLDKDLYQVFWDATGTMEVIASHFLHDYLILYSKSTEEKRHNIDDDELGIKFETKAIEARHAAALLEKHCKTVRALKQSRIEKYLNHGNTKVSPPSHGNKKVSPPSGTKSAPKTKAATKPSTSTAATSTSTPVPTSLTLSNAGVMAAAVPSSVTSSTHSSTTATMAAKEATSNVRKSVTNKRNHSLMTKPTTTTSSSAEMVFASSKQPIPATTPSNSVITIDVDTETSSTSKITPTKMRKVSSDPLKSTTTSTTSQPVPSSIEEDLQNLEPKQYLKRRIAKYFGRELYFGTVKKWIPPCDNDEGVDLWLVRYDDNDAEDLEREELVEGLKLWLQDPTKDIVGGPK